MANDFPSDDVEGFIEIGRISKLRKEIDEKQEVTKYLKKRMSVVDIIPCNFNVPYATILENPTSFFKPEIKYIDAIGKFKGQLMSYGLKQYSFVRLYLTNMTSQSDSFSNDYTKNIIDSTIDSLTSGQKIEKFKTFTNTVRGLGAGDNKIGDTLKTFLPISDSTASLINTALTTGLRINFPKIWTGSSYSPNLSLNVRLVSPYGTPKAISKFIIEPLGYLFILLSPQTEYGVTTFNPGYFTIKSYGVNNMSLCYLTSFEMRRGGDDSSYNMYKQPMVVDIALSFASSTEGFAVYRPLPDKSDPDKVLSLDLPDNEGRIFCDGTTIKSYEKEFTDPSALFTTLRNIVNSFRPFGYEQSNEATLNTSQNTGSSTGNIATDKSGLQISTTQTSTSTVSSTQSIVYYTGTLAVSKPDNVTANDTLQVHIISNTGEVMNTSYSVGNLSTVSSNTLTGQPSEVQLNIGDLITANNGYLVRTRYITSDGVGSWSESYPIPANYDSTKSIVKSEISPNHLSFEGYRFSTTNSSGDSSGPYIADTGLPISVDGGMYNVSVLDKNGNTVSSRQIPFPVSNSSEDLTKDTVNSNPITAKFLTIEKNNISQTESYLNFSVNTSSGGLKGTFIVDNSYNIDDFHFYLTSDFGQSSFVGYQNNILLQDLDAGKYYFTIKYGDTVIPFSDTSIQNSIVIQENVILHVIFTITYNNKINSLVVSGVQVQAL